MPDFWNPELFAVPLLMETGTRLVDKSASPKRKNNNLKIQQDYGNKWNFEV